MAMEGILHLKLNGKIELISALGQLLEVGFSHNFFNGVINSQMGSKKSTNKFLDLGSLDS